MQRHQSNRIVVSIFGVMITTLAGAPTRAAPPSSLTDPRTGATVETPLRSQPDPLQDPTLPRKRVFAESFAPARPQRLGTLRSPACEIATRPDFKGAALRYERRPPFRCALLLSATPSTFYWIERQRSSTAPVIDLEVIEARYPLVDPATPNHGGDVDRLVADRWVRRSTILATHSFPRAPPVGGWEQSATLLLTTPATRTLVFIVADPEADDGPPGATAFFDDLVIDTLIPTPEQETSLLAKLDLSPFDAGSGLVHRGVVADNGGAATPQSGRVTNVRTTLFTPAPTTFKLATPLAEGTSLWLDFGLHTLSPPHDIVHFDVRVRGERGEDESVWSQSLLADGHTEPWQTADIDLGRFASQKVEITLSTTPTPKGRGRGLWGPPLLATPIGPEDPPSILLITVGGLRADRLGLAGYPRPTSPSLDTLAKRAAVFDAAVSPSNASRFVVGSLFTGLSPTALGLANPAHNLPRDVHTLAEALSVQGLVTAAFVADPALAGQGLDRGFDALAVWPRDTPASTIVAAARHFLETHAHRRFFLYLHFSDPLQPFDPPQAARDRFVPAAELLRFGLETPFSVSARGQVSGCDRCNNAAGLNSAFPTLVSDLYDSEIAGLDAALGTLFESLARLGIDDETVVAVTGTHGELVWDHGDVFGHPAHDFSDPVVRVPLIIKPAGPPHSLRVAAQVRTLDLWPTLLELANAPVPQPSPIAESLATLFHSQSTSLVHERVAVSESPRGDRFAVREKGFKLLGTRSRDGHFAAALYDLARDPRELHDLSAELPDTVDQLLWSALDVAATARPGDYLLVVLPTAGRTFRLNAKSPEALTSVEPFCDGPVRLAPTRTAFEVSGPVGARRWRVFRMVGIPETPLVLELTVAGAKPVHLRRTLLPSTPREPLASVLAQLVHGGEADLALVRVVGPGVGP